MHNLQPIHTKLKPEEVKKLLTELNISLSQIPKIKITDPAIPKECQISDVVKIERECDGRKSFFYRVVSV